MLACRGDDGCDEWRNQITRERFWVKTYRKSVTIMFGSLLLCLSLSAARPHPKKGLHCSTHKATRQGTQKKENNKPMNYYQFCSNDTKIISCGAPVDPDGPSRRQSDSPPSPLADRT